jgi:hypothetical protein
MAIDVNNKQQMNQTVKGFEAYRKLLLSGKLEKDKVIFDAVRAVVKEVSVIPKDPTIIWLSNLKTADLEPELRGEATLADQLHNYWNSSWNIASKVSTLDRLVSYKLYGYWNTNTAKAPDDVMDVMRNTEALYRLYSDRVHRLVNASKIISSKMYRLNKNAPLTPASSTSWRDRVTNAYARSILPLQIGRYLKAFVLGEEVFDDPTIATSTSKPTMDFVKACKVVATNLYSILFINNKLILVEKPTLSLDSREFLHNETGPAITFPKLGSGIYCLNNVRVTKDVVLKPADQLKADLITKTRNAEVRRELVRKIGIERVLSELGATTLDKSQDGIYELVTLDLGDGRSRPYLKMLNPSIGTWHIEGVEPRTTTVAAALRYRNGTEAMPVILT